MVRRGRQSVQALVQGEFVSMVGDTFADWPASASTVADGAFADVSASASDSRTAPTQVRHLASIEGGVMPVHLANHQLTPPPPFVT